MHMPSKIVVILAHAWCASARGGWGGRDMQHWLLPLANGDSVPNSWLPFFARANQECCTFAMR